MKEKKLGLHIFRGMVPFVFLALLILIPVGIYSIMAMGFPPVIGNLTAAQAIRKYAAQVYPEWEPEGIWAGYNLVDDRYYLDFTKDEDKYTLGYAWHEGQVKDVGREEALLAQTEVERVIRINGLWMPDQLVTYCSVRWTANAPDTPLISADSRFYTQAGFGQMELREQMADVGMKTWEALSPVVPIHTLSVHCGQQELEEGITWTVFHLELEEGQPVTRELLLSAPVTVKEFS